MIREAKHSTIPGLDPGISGVEGAKHSTTPGLEPGISGGEGAKHSTIPGLDPAVTAAAVAIAVETPVQDDVRALVAELNDTLLALTPREFCHHMTVEQMADLATTVFVARADGAAVGMGALRRDAAGFGEVKRMYTRRAWQGRGIGGAILAGIEALARREGIRHLMLETGDRHPAAWRVYERGGFTRCGPIPGYPDTKWSVFYEKKLAA
jgi:putative acetyltransferase